MIIHKQLIFQDDRGAMIDLSPPGRGLCGPSQSGTSTLMSRLAIPMAFPVVPSFQTRANIWQTSTCHDFIYGKPFGKPFCIFQCHHQHPTKTAHRILVVTGPCGPFGLGIAPDVLPRELLMQCQKARGEFADLDDQWNQSQRCCCCNIIFGNS